MQEIEPYYLWREYYTTEEDKLSPFFGKEYSEFEYSNTIYNFLIHPQWDEFGSSTLYIKIIYADYQEGFAVIEMIGEWNDCLYNDIMYFKREVIDHMTRNGINKYILIGENVLNFHSGDDDYYEEWIDDLEDGWIAAINFREHVEEEMCTGRIDQFIVLGNPFNNLNWRKLKPKALCAAVEALFHKRLAPPQ
jgi:hypothetical protein